jgi:cbb3-type cytochrome c oxidase subunit III
MALAALLTACGLEPPAGDARGPAVFETCATCHGSEGQGMHEYGAPAIAGLPDWYLRAQLDKFQSGARGAHPDDVQGLRMRSMARSLVHEGDVEAIVAYVAALPAVQPNDGSGDATHGQQVYATCAQCHGDNAMGDQTRGAPPLVNLDGWYVETQIHNFRNGVRGASPLDETGRTMAPMALGLADEQSIRDVVAYIRTLRGS